MQNQAYSDALQQTIAWMQQEQSKKGDLLKDRFQETTDSLKPLRLLQGAAKEIVIEAAGMDDLIVPVVGLVLGNLLKRAVNGKSENETRLAIGAALQVSITTLIIKHPEEIKSVARSAYQFLFGKRKSREESNTEQSF